MSAYEEDLNITIRINADDQASPALQAVTQEVQQLNASVTETGQATQQINVPLQATNKLVEETGKQVHAATLPMRVLGRDLMSIAFGINLVARVLGVSNPALQSFVALLMIVGVAMRTVGIIQQLAKWIHEYNFATQLATISTWHFGAALANAAFWKTMLLGGLVGAASLMVGLTAFAAMQGAQPKGSMQFGGTIPETGMYMLHKGETVTPVGGSNYSNITINMQTGAISSSVDVDNMLSQMALRMAVESRRRTGR